MMFIREGNNMLNRFMAILLVLTVLSTSVLFSASAELTPEDAGYYHAVNDPGYRDVINTALDVGFVWNDNMLLENSSILSTDIAKASIALSTLAYDSYELDQVLESEEMGFTLAGGLNSYGPRTFLDNDHVAYRIATKQIDSYLAYCIPVRGTVSGEWYSNFNLGYDNGGVHLGFSLAAEELMNELRTILRSDNADSSHRIIWLTGHSRGAAVSNMVAARLVEEGLVSEEHLFSYNFACPAVSKSAGPCSGVFNFLNSGDVVPVVPLDIWGYKRYGTDIERAAPEVPTVDERFFQDHASAFVGYEGNETIKAVLTFLIPTETAFFRPPVQIGVLVLASILGGAATTEDTLQATFQSLMQQGGYDLIADRFESVPSFYTTALDLYEYFTDTDNLAEIFFQSIADITDPDEKMSKLGNDLRNRLEWVAGITINSVQNVIDAVNVVKEAIIQVNAAREMVGAFTNLFLEGGVNPIEALKNGHDQKTYCYWTNSTYLGYKGKYKSDIGDSYWADTHTVGPYCFSECPNLTSVTFSNTAYIGQNAFSDSAISGTLELPEGLLSVGRYAFDNCPGLTAISLPHTVQWLAPRSFSCPNALEVTIPVEVPAAEAFSVPQVHTIHYLAGSTGIMPDRRGYNGSFLPGLDRSWTLEESCIRNLSTITFEEGVIHIAAEAFKAVSGQNICEGALTSVTLPSTVQSIGVSAFYRQENLKEINLPEDFQELGEGCFENTGLESITIPGKVKAIPKYCFRSCAQLLSADFPEGLESIDDYAFDGCEALEKLLLPHTLKSIGMDAFSGTYALREMSIPIELCSENMLWVRNLGKIEKIHYLVGSTGIMPDRSGGLHNNRALEQTVHSSLREVDFEEGITHIGDYALTSWGPYGVGSSIGALEKVTLPSTLKTIGISVFHGQKGLTGIDLPEGIESLGESCFQGSGLREIDLPSTLNAIGKQCFQYCDSLGFVRFHGNAPAFDGNAVFYEDVAELIWPADKSGWDGSIDALDLAGLFCHPDNEPVLRVPEHIRTLEESALAEIGVSMIELLPGVEAVGSDAFYSTQRDLLIRVPSSVENIAENAFRSDGRVFLVTPENSPAWEYAGENGIYRIAALE